MTDLGTPKPEGSGVETTARLYLDAAAAAQNRPEGDHLTRQAARLNQQLRERPTTP